MASTHTGWVRGALLGCGLQSLACYTGLGGQADGDAGETSAGASAGSASASGAGSDGSSDDGVPPPEDAGQVGRTGLRRLTANEYDNTVRDLLQGDEAASALLLPYDKPTPFDNDYTNQIPSKALVEGADLLAADAADRLAEDPARRDLVVGCTPSGPGDEGCMASFITQFGRRALRRPLRDEELALFLHGENGDDGVLDYAVAEGDFYVGVDSFVRLILQDPEFLYRVELGQPVEGEPGVYKLDDFEVGTRLSYFVVGAGPTEALLDRAAAGALSTPADVRAAAQELLDDPRALDRVARFHALWLGYAQLSVSGELALAMVDESKALLQRIIFDDRIAWQNLFSFDETYVDDTLAAHYGLPLPGSDTPTWVPYGDSGRAGLLSHGTFLSVGAKFNDTSPVQRGKLIRTRLFCQDIPPPPPTVNVDVAPEGAVCKQERYAAHSAGGCAGCHEQMDPVGFGLENYDNVGRYREYELDNPDTPDDESQCQIEGQGELVGIGAFHGPAELGELALSAGLLNRCVAQQLYRYGVGRYELDEIDEAFIDHVIERVGAGDFEFRDLVLEYVASDAFGYRREQE
ncbi:MAG: DUF1588 domain-containing protein [Deltaproteobacteria bacterium]|nr:DUF1588 domain-containing protein [Deltaproteobacteria bacterium]